MNMKKTALVLALALATLVGGCSKEDDMTRGIDGTNREWVNRVLNEYGLLAHPDVQSEMQRSVAGYRAQFNELGSAGKEEEAQALQERSAYELRLWIQDWARNHQTEALDYLSEAEYKEVTGK